MRACVCVCVVKAIKTFADPIYKLYTRERLAVDLRWSLDDDDNDDDDFPAASLSWLCGDRVCAASVRQRACFGYLLLHGGTH